MHIEVRRADRSDRTAILELATRSLGWQGDERDRAFFEWKHDHSPFGPSPAWLAEHDGELVGFRTFMRWAFGDGTRRLEVVRAVDTATDPAHQGKGVFRTLTLAAVDELTADGTAAVFNTPNEQSRPGYLKMGWHQLGRPTLSVVPRSPAALVRLARTRESAGKWGESVDVGVPAAIALADPAVGALLAACRSRRGWSTPRSPELLRWRYGFEPLGYRAIEVRGGLCIFRVRSRGTSREVAIYEWLSPRRDPRAVLRLVRACGDYGVGIGLSTRCHAAVPIPRQGPIVTWRPLARREVPALADLAFELGDLELF